MTITKYLCKRYDRHNKGYVTLGDIIRRYNYLNILLFICYFVLVLLIISLANIIGEVFYQKFYPHLSNSEYLIFSIDKILIGFAIFGIILLLILVFLIILDALSKIYNFVWNNLKQTKIVVCQRKDKS